MRETAVDDLLLEIVTHPSELRPQSHRPRDQPESLWQSQDVGKMYIFWPENIGWHSVGEISTKGAF